MPSSEIALIFRWILLLWALGWLVLPLSSRLFSFLPDKGLASGRIVALTFVGLIAFWGAATHLVPLRLAPFLLIGASMVAGIGWRSAAFRARIRQNWRAVLVSDAVFLLAFAGFLWVRMRHPEAGDLEKPMDMALISSAMRAQWLPFQNPWFAGQSFTNYYYFGPFLSAMTARTLATPPHFAYNLLQPMWAAFFLSATWSLGAALAKSAKVGVVAMLLVGLGGHFEPLRQWSQTKQLWPLDWWKTSRVIENTINEYPAFTLFTGDMHAHFFAFSLALTHFSICFGIVKTDSPRLRSLLLLLGGVLLGVFALTNTWDAPFYGILLLASALHSLPSRGRGDKWRVLGLLGLSFSLPVLFKMAQTASPRMWIALVFVAVPLEIEAWKSLAKGFKNVPHPRKNDIFQAATPFFVAPLVALPYLLRFQSQVSGVAFDLWKPDLFSLALFWGSWWMLGFFALALDAGEETPSVEAIFRRLLIIVGGGALLFPFFFYVRGAFGDGDLRHQDTVFKFGLQAWLLLGTGIACEVGFRLKSGWKRAPIPQKMMASLAMVAFFAVVSLAPACVAWTRTVRDAPLDEAGNPIQSLDAARFLPADERQGIGWLRQNARSGESLVEPIFIEDGQIRGDFKAEFGRIAAFSGVPNVVGWPQHIASWGAPWEEINRRAALVTAIYSEADPVPALEQLGATYVFLSAPPHPLWKQNPRLKLVWSDAKTEGGAQIWKFSR